MRQKWTRCSSESFIVLFTIKSTAEVWKTIVKKRKDSLCWRAFLVMRAYFVWRFASTEHSRRIEALRNASHFIVKALWRQSSWKESNKLDRVIFAETIFRNLFSGFFGLLFAMTLRLKRRRRIQSEWKQDFSVCSRDDRAQTGHGPMSRVRKTQ